MGSVLGFLDTIYTSFVSFAYIVEHLGMRNTCIQIVILSIAHILDILLSHIYIAQRVMILLLH